MLVKCRPPAIRLAKVDEEDRPLMTPVEPLRSSRRNDILGMIPDGHTLVAVAAGEDATALVLQKVRDGSIIESVWLLGSASGTLDEVQGMPPEPGRLQDRRVRAEWDGAGKTLAVLAESRGGSYRTRLGVVRPPSVECNWVAQLSAVDADMAWLGDEMCISYPGEQRNYITRVAPSTGASRVLYDERRSPPRHGIPWGLCVSPNEHYVLFGRIAYADGYDNNGIWLLDARTGACVELTFEDAQSYHHRPVGWEGPATVVFEAFSSSGNGVYYRAYLEPSWPSTP
jgi:hypothetical protein